MMFPLTRTKLVMPQPRTNLLSRGRLVDLFADLLDYRLFIVSAPAGYGKTSLLVDLAQHVDLPFCWLALDPLDRDPQRFIAHFIASLSERFPDFGQRSGQVLDGAATHFDPDRILGVLLKEIDEQIREHFVIVLDDYQFVDASPVIVSFLDGFLREAGENAHLLLSSRSLISLPSMPLLVGRSQVSGLSFRELAFQKDEIQALILQNYNVEIPENAAEELARETEGWITGLLLSAETMWQGMADRIRVARASGVGLEDYLTQQVLDQQSPDVQEFLLRTSLFEEFDLSLCVQVLQPVPYPENTDLRSLMDRVVKSNLFVWQVGEQKSWIRYNPLFRDFLRSRLEQSRPSERELILRRMATTFERRQEWESAYEQYRLLDDSEAAADLVATAESSLIANGRLTLLSEWLGRIPREIMSRRPHLVALRGFVAILLGEVERGAGLLERAVRALRESDDQAGLCQALLWMAIAHQNLGKYQSSLEEADEALALADGKESLLSLSAEAVNVKGDVLFRIGRLDEAVECVERAKAAYDSLEDGDNVARLNMNLGLFYTQRGDLPLAKASYETALAYWRSEGKTLWEPMLLNNLAMLHQLSGAYEQAAVSLEAALAGARANGYAPVEAHILSTTGDLYIDLDDPDAAQNAYAQARTIAERMNNRFLRVYLDLAECGAARMRREWERADRFLLSATRLAEEDGSNFELALCQVEKGRLALARGDAAQATTFLDTGVKELENLGQRIEASRAYLLTAIAWHQREERAAALSNLKRALDLAPIPGSRQHLVVTGRIGTSLLNDLQSDSNCDGQASRLLKDVLEFERRLPGMRRRLRRREMAIAVGPPKLIIRTLGRCSVVAGDHEIANADWQTQRARELFFLFLAHPEPLTKEVVGTLLWPDASPSQLKIHFRNSLYRLRHAIGQQVIVFDRDQERYWFNRDLDYEYDAETFARKIAEAQRARELQDKIGLYRTAIELYKGPFMPDMEGIWVLSHREQLAEAYLQGTLEIAEIQLQCSDFPNALHYSRVAIREDPGLEEAHRKAMRAYAAMGDRKSVVRQFERCCDYLLSELGAQPSEETTKLFERLTK